MFYFEIGHCSSWIQSSPFSTLPEARGGSCAGDGSTIALWYCHSGRVSRCDASQYLPKTNLLRLVGLCVCVPKLLLQARFPEEHKMTASMIHQIFGKCSRSFFWEFRGFLRVLNYYLKRGRFIIIEKRQIGKHRNRKNEVLFQTSAGDHFSAQ